MAMVLDSGSRGPVAPKKQVKDASGRLPFNVGYSGPTAPVARPTPVAPRATPAPPTRSYAEPRDPVGGYSSGGPRGGQARSAPTRQTVSGVTASSTGAYSGARTADAAPAGPLPGSPEWDPSGDAAYLLAKGGIEKDTDSLLADLARQRSTYDIDFGKALRNLGWHGPEGAGGIDDVIARGTWNEDDTLGAYGQSLENQENDFAGRGMMNSSFYAKALQDLLTSFNDQRSSLVDSRSSFLADATAQETDAKTRRDQAIAMARAEAAARASALLGLGGGI